MPGPGREREITDREILRAIRLHPDPAVTPSEVANDVGMSNQGVNKRLNDLNEQDKVVRKDVGARAVVYWLSEEGKEALSES